MNESTNVRVAHVLVCYLRRLGVSLRLNDQGDGLELQPAEKLCPGDRGHLRDVKCELVALLKAQAVVDEDSEIREHLDRLPHLKRQTT